MKLTLHYLSFDMKRWQTLARTLWGLAALYALLADLCLFSFWDSLQRGSMRDLMAFCRVLLVAGGVLLCVFAAWADSPARESSWMRTRPGRGWRLALARLLFVLLTLALPLAAAYAVELMTMRFDAATVAGEAFHLFLTVLATGAMLMLWAGAAPSRAGLLIGAGLSLLVLAGACTWEWLTPAPWERAWPHPVLCAFILTLPVLWIARDLRHKQTEGKWIFAGFLGGVSAIVLLAMLPLFQSFYESLKAAGPLQSTLFKEGEWSVEATGPATKIRPVTDEEWSGAGTSLYLPFKGTLPEAASGLRVESVSLSTFSWRANPSGDWSPPEPVSGSGILPDASREDAGKGILGWSWTGRPPAVKMREGEIRLQARMIFQEESSVRLPVKKHGSTGRDGWSFEILDYDRHFDAWLSESLLLHPYREGRLEMSAVHRHAAFSRWRLGVPPESHSLQPGWRMEVESPESHFLRPDWRDGVLKRPFENEHTSLITTRAKTFRASWQVAPPASTPELTLRYARTREVVDTVIHIRHASLETESSITPWVESSPSLPAQPPSRPVLRPWITQRRSGIPSPDAGYEEVSTWLDQASLHRRTGEIFRWNRDPETLRRLKALVASRPDFFAKQIGRDGHEGFIASALIEGVPEEKRMKFLQVIPQVPRLMKIAAARGWQEEAKPFLLKGLGVDGLNRDYSLAALCREYRDPAFHPVLLRNFHLSLPFIRYWQSMPDLAPGLASKLVEARRRPSFDYQEATAARLYAGDRSALSSLLRERRGSGPAGFHACIRDEEDRPLPLDGSAADASRDTTVDDYLYDPVRHRFLKKPAFQTP